MLELLCRRPRAYDLQAPVTTRTRDLIAVPAIAEPHQGTSYNPPVDAHQELLEKAAAIEQKSLEQAAKLALTKQKMELAKVTEAVYDMSVASGMAVQELGDDADEDEEGEDEVAANSQSKKLPERRTTSQKNKAARLLKEVRAFLEPDGKKN